MAAVAPASPVQGAEAREQPPAEPAHVAAARALVVACQAELERSPDERRAGRLYYELARASEWPLGELDRAADYLRHAVRLQPECAPYVHVARRVHEARGAWGPAVAALDTEVAMCTEPRRRASLLVEKGAVLERRLGDAPAAREAYLAALEHDPESIPALAAWCGNAERGGRAEELERALGRLAAALNDDRVRAALLTRRGRLLELLDRAEEAIEAHREAHALDVGAPGPLRAIERLARAKGRWSEVAQALERRAELAADPRHRAALLGEAARVLESRLERADDACSLLERAAAEVPVDRLPLAELVRLYEQRRRPTELVRALERLHEIAAREEAREEARALASRIARVQASLLDDRAGAVTWAGRALDQAPADPAAIALLVPLLAKEGRWEAVVAALLRQAEHEVSPHRRAGAHARAAEVFERELGRPDLAIVHHARAAAHEPALSESVHALVRLYTEGGRHRELAELCEHAAGLASDAAARVAWWLRAAELYEGVLAAPARAASLYARALEAPPGTLPALQGLGRALERAGDLPAAAQALEAEARVASAPAERAALLHRAGRMLAERGRDPAAAVPYWEAALAAVPEHDDVHAALAAALRAQGRWEELVALLARKVTVTADARAAADLLYEVGLLFEERLARDVDAVERWRAALSRDPLHAGALAALGRKLGERHQWEELVHLLELELGRPGDAATRVRVALRLGDVLEAHLGKRERALAAYEQALALRPQLREALEARARLLGEAGRWDALAGHLEDEAKATRDDAVAVAALLDAAEIWRDRLERPADAKRCYEVALTRDPTHRGALLAASALASDDAERARALMALAPTVADPTYRAVHASEAARAAEAASGLESLVESAAHQVLQIDPTDETALARLERLAGGRGDRALLANVLARRGASAPDGVAAATHHARLGWLLESAGDASALDVMRVALARDPESIAAARGLSVLAERAADPELLLAAATAEAHAARDRTRAADLMGRAAEVLRLRGDEGAALAALERALTLEPEHPGVATALVRLALSRGEVDRAVDAIAGAEQGARARGRKSALGVELSRLQADARRDLPAALATLRRVLKETPTDVPALLAIADLFARDGQIPEAVDRLTQALSCEPTQEEAISAHLRLASLRDERLGDPDRARESLDAVLALDPEQREALERLLALQVRCDELDAAAATAERLARVATDATQRGRALTLVARVARRRGDLAAAVTAYAGAVGDLGYGAEGRELAELLAGEQSAQRAAGFAAYAEALAAWIASGRGGPRETAGALGELARALEDELGRGSEALTALRRAVELAPEELELRAQLSTRLLRAGHAAAAADELRRVLDHDVTRAAAWRELHQALLGARGPVEAAHALGPLVALGVATSEERAALAATPPAVARARPGTFDGPVFRVLDLARPGDPAIELVAALAETLHKLEPRDLARYGLASKDKLTARGGHPLRVLTDRIAVSLGIDELEVYVHRAHAGAVEVEPGDPPSLLVPAALLTLSEPALAFLVARSLALVARRLHAFERLPPERVEELVTAAVRAVEPRWGVGWADEAWLAEQSRRITKALSRRGRRAVEEFVPAYVRQPRADFAALAADQRLVAARAGLLLADDLPAAVDVVRRLEGDLGGVKGVALALAMRQVHDLLRFWVTDAAFAVRRRLLGG
ncbi:MAG: hypothetical protein IT376_03180 [Polyangiaceae bacterium]|nr:hypothetical protein [Polyangiaceae bacterium]